MYCSYCNTVYCNYCCDTVYFSYCGTVDTTDSERDNEIDPVFITMYLVLLKLKQFDCCRYHNTDLPIQDKTLFTLGPLLNGVGGIYTKYLCKTRDKMVEKHITRYLKNTN